MMMAVEFLPPAQAEAIDLANWPFFLSFFLFSLFYSIRLATIVVCYWAFYTCKLCARISFTFCCFQVDVSWVEGGGDPPLSLSLSISFSWVKKGHRAVSHHSPLALYVEISLSHSFLVIIPMVTVYVRVYLDRVCVHRLIVSIAINQIEFVEIDQFDWKFRLKIPTRVWNQLDCLQCDVH